MFITKHGFFEISRGCPKYRQYKFRQPALKIPVLHLISYLAHSQAHCHYVSKYLSATPTKPSGLYPSFHLWASMFTLSRHLLCPGTISQLSANSSSTLLHPYVMKFAAQESHLRQSCVCWREKNPTPTFPPTTSRLGRLPPQTSPQDSGQMQLLQK